MKGNLRDVIEIALGISTPKRELDLIERRLKAARKHYEEHYGEKKR